MSRQGAVSTDPLSPCTGVCRLDPVTGWCEGCYRTAEEIAGWLTKSKVERSAILMRIEKRKRG